jgi:rod shape-determining protein MreC
VVTLSSDTRPIIGHGPPLGARLFFLGLLAVAVMVLDHRGQYLETARAWMSVAMTPLYAAVEAPGTFWSWMTGSVRDRAALRVENARLIEELHASRVKLLQYDALMEENERLRALRSASQGIAERTLIAEIINVDDIDPFRHRMRINKGIVDGVYKRQPVLDAFGIVGQVVRVDRYSAQVILISDAAHAMQVQINRNGIRSIASGIGDLNKLSLPYMTIESDVKVDDLLVSSGLDGIFPPGYPVARVSKVERDPSATFAVVEAKPLAQLDRNREVLLLWANKPPAEKPPLVAPAPKDAPPAAPPVER